MFKKRDHKKNTSTCRMRIDKREKVLSILLLPSSDMNYGFDGEHKEDLFIDNKSKFTILAPFKEENYFNWKIKILKDTNWIGKELKYDFDVDCLVKTFYGDKKIRIYKKWMSRKNKRDFTKVLKYLYTPFFLAVCFKELGTEKNNSIELKFFKNYYQNIPLLQPWLKDIFGLESTLIRNNDFIIVKLDKENSIKFKELTKTVNIKY